MPVAINTATISGRLVQDPIRRDLRGVTAAQMRIASSRSFTKRDGNASDETVYIDIDCYGRNAENCLSSLHKGDQVVVCGRLAMDIWTGQDGRQYSRLYIKADTVIFPERA